VNKDLARKIAFYGVFAALAVIIAFIERQLPPPVPLLGVKWGLANVVVIMILYAFNPRWAVSISVLRVVIVSLLFGSVSAAIMAMSGAMASFVVMYIFKKMGIFGIIGVSVVGGVAHGIAQIAVAMVVLSTPGLMFHTPVLVISGTITGVIVGVVAGLALRNIKVIRRQGGS